MLTFCAGCAGEISSGAVMRGSWLYCSLECALSPGSFTVSPGESLVIAPRSVRSPQTAQRRLRAQRSTEIGTKPKVA